MAKFVTYGSIEQYRSVVRNVQQWFEHNDKPKGDMWFHGTVKLHGTNAGIGYDCLTGEVWAQSRQNIITVEKDNAGFAAWVEKNKEPITEFMKIVDGFTEDAPIKVIYGEWAGGNIQKGVGISGLEKFFCLFDVKLVYSTDAQLEDGNQQDNKYVGHNGVKAIFATMREELEAIRFFCAENFQTYDMKIDFSFPEKSIDDLIKITMDVEAECPVAKALGQSGVGEGVVWQSWEKPNLRFKSKGEKHSDTHVKVIVAVDVEKLESVRAFVHMVLTDHRMEKMIDSMKLEGLEISPKTTGNFLKLVMNDVLKEETDTFIANGFVWKDLTGPLSKTARDWYLAKCQEF